MNSLMSIRYPYPFTYPYNCHTVESILEGLFCQRDGWLKLAIGENIIVKTIYSYLQLYMATVVNTIFLILQVRKLMHR